MRHCKLALVQPENWNLCDNFCPLVPLNSVPIQSICSPFRLSITWFMCDSIRCCCCFFDSFVMYQYIIRHWHLYIAKFMLTIKMMAWKICACAFSYRNLPKTFPTIEKRNVFRTACHCRTMFRFTIVGSLHIRMPNVNTELGHSTVKMLSDSSTLLVCSRRRGGMPYPYG